MDADCSRLCRICVSSSENCSQMISIFAEDSLWKKITTLADVKIEEGDTLPQQICVICARSVISACLLKKKCEDADNFFRQKLLMQRIESHEIRSDENKVDSTENGETDEKYEKPKIRKGYEYSDSTSPTKNFIEIGSENSSESFKNYANRCNGLYNKNTNEIIGDAGDATIAQSGDKAPFNLHSIRLMHEYMQQQLCKLNRAPENYDEGGGSGSDDNADDDDPSPLIPEIELITPSEDTTISGCGGANTSGTAFSPLRGYQCPNCFQIFEMKHILKEHMQSVHGTMGPVYECSNCKKTYFYKRFLEKHVRRGRCVKKRRNQTRPMQCSDCHVLFPTGHHLGWHKRTGCPSRVAKLPLQQLFKQNIIQYNNFPKRIGVRKPENAIYLHNRKLLMANKRKGRTRIKLDAKKIALAKQLILREATTTVIANELNISRTFAWRLRKSLVNGVSLHERVIDPNSEETLESSLQQQLLAHEQERQEHIPDPNIDFKSEGDGDDFDDDDIEEDGGPLKDEIRADNRDESDDNECMKIPKSEICDLMSENEKYPESSYAEMEVEAGNKDGEKNVIYHTHDTNETRTHDDHEEDGVEVDDARPQNKEQRQSEHQNEVEQQLLLRNIDLHGTSSEKAVETAPVMKDFKIKRSYINGEKDLPLVIPPFHQFPTATAVQINQLPVNLSVRPPSTLPKKKMAFLPAESESKIQVTKKPRKPNVFIDDEKYAMAQNLVAQNASTMEIARALNVSQMTAWKARDAIIKGVPLSYRNKRGDVGAHRLPMNSKYEKNVNNTHPPESVEIGAQMTENQLRSHEQQEQKIQQQEHQQKFFENHLVEKQHQEQHMKLLQIHQMQQQQQLHQQLFLQEQNQRPQEENFDQPIRPRKLQEMQLHSLPMTNTAFQHSNSKTNTDYNSNNNGGTIAKPSHPRRRLKAAEREKRDKEITREILELINEDSSIQYWKVSARLAEKGYPISPSSVCQKLKSMGIHRRWKPGDRPPLTSGPADVEHLKTNLNTSAAASVTSSADEGYDQQFELGGAHFLTAFTR